MDVAHSADGLGVERRPAQPPHVGRSMGTGNSQYGPVMADSLQSGAVISQVAAPSSNQLDNGGGANDWFDSFSCNRSTFQGPMVVLDRPSSPPQQPVSAEVEAIKHDLSYRPSQLVRLLNSTPLGEVISERQLYRHRQRAGAVLGEGRRVNLLSFVAWLVHQRTRIGQRPSGKIGTREVFRLLEYQDYRCALTNRQLTPENAALDHILPVSRGGEHRIENAQIVVKDVNRAKGTLTSAEFIQLCREVVAHADRTSEINHQQEKDA